MPHHTQPHHRTHLDLRSPFVLDLHELGRRAGSMREVQLPIAVPAGWRVGVVTVPEGSVLDADLKLESVMDGVLVSGVATAVVSAECGRCLEPLQQPLEAPVQELFFYDADGEEDVAVVEGDLIDLEPVLRDSVILALPVNPICDEDCAGLCPTCGERLAELPAGHAHDDIDARWAALAPLTSAPLTSATLAPETLTSADHESAEPEEH